jgi:hypothetical protein
MSTSRKPFMPLDVDDEKLERLAAERGVGRLEPPAKRSREGDRLVPAQVTAPSPANNAAPASKLKTVNLELPDYVWTDLKIRAAHQQTSLKHVIMTALRKDGIMIKDADMIEDGRRLRGSNRTAAAQ